MADADILGVTCLYVRIQLGYAVHTNPLGGLRSFRQGSLFKLSCQFERIPFLAHPLDACSGKGSAINFPYRTNVGWPV